MPGKSVMDAGRIIIACWERHRLRADEASALLNASRLTDSFNCSPPQPAKLLNEAAKLLVFLHRPSVTTNNDEAVGEFAFDAGPITLSDDAPRGHWMAASGSLSCATAHGMVNRVLGHSAAERTNTTMT